MSTHRLHSNSAGCLSHQQPPRVPVAEEEIAAHHPAPSLPPQSVFYTLTQREAMATWLVLAPEGGRRKASKWWELSHGLLHLQPHGVRVQASEELHLCSMPRGRQGSHRFSEQGW